MPEHVASDSDEVPEVAQRLLERLRPTHAQAFGELHGFAETVGLDAELPASAEQYVALYRRLQEAGYRDVLRKRYGYGFKDVWRSFQAQYREWEREYKASEWKQPPLLAPKPTVLTRGERRRTLTRADWSSYWPLKVGSPD